MVNKIVLHFTPKFILFTLAPAVLTRVKLVFALDLVEKSDVVLKGLSSILLFPLVFIILINGAAGGCKRGLRLCHDHLNGTLSVLHWDCRSSETA